MKKDAIWSQAEEPWMRWLDMAQEYLSELGITILNAVEFTKDLNNC